MNIKKYIVIVLAYILLFVCGFFAPIMYKQSALGRLVSHIRIKPAIASAYQQKVNIEIMPSGTEDSSYSPLSADEGSGMVRLLLGDNNLESRLGDAINIDEYLKNNSYRSQDVVLSTPLSNYDLGIENMIYKIIMNSDSRMNQPQAKRYAKWFVQYSKQYNVHPLLSVAVGFRESRFNSSSVSCAGAAGIMQLMPITAREVGISDRHDPEQSIKGGVKYLHNQLSSFHNLRLALAAYNAGPSVIKNNGRTFPLPRGYRETNHYVPHVESFLRQQLQSFGMNPKTVNDFHFWFTT